LLVSACSKVEERGKRGQETESTESERTEPSLPVPAQHSP
jgi:hypothetical protein